MDKMINNYVNLYGMSKTFRFSALPVGETETNFVKNLFLESDTRRAKDYIIVKELIDDYHRQFIEKALPGVTFEGLSEYAEIYYKRNKSDDDIKDRTNKEEKFRKAIVAHIKSHSEYKLLWKNKDFIDKTLPEFIEDEEKKKIVESFHGFATYFTGFFTNRENMYSSEEKSTSIAYRCIHDNLPRFLDNLRTYNAIIDTLPKDNLYEINDMISELYGKTMEEVFVLERFGDYLTQSGIDRYNSIIGAYTNSDGSKVKGINEFINQFNQTVKDKHKRLPMFKPLYKQILGKTESISFIPETFKDDRELLSAIDKMFNDEKSGLSLVFKKIHNLLSTLDSFDEKGIYIVNKKAISDISNKMFDDWNYIFTQWGEEYDRKHDGKKKNEKYLDERSKAFKKVESFSLEEIKKYLSDKSIHEYISERSEYYYNQFISAVSGICDVFSNYEGKLSEDETTVSNIKRLLDCGKDYKNFAEILTGSGLEEDKDNAFYGSFIPLFDSLSEFDRLYDKVRNHVTKKPYKVDKIKLNFDCSSFLSGWSQPSDFSSKAAHIFEKNGDYFLYVVNRRLSNEEQEDLSIIGDSSEECTHIEYWFQKPDNKNVPRLFIRSKGDRYAPAVAKYNLPINDIIEIYDNGWFKTEYAKTNPQLFKESLTKLIDYFKLGFERHEDYCYFDFHWKESSEYNNISEFYNDVIASCYKIVKTQFDFTKLLKLVAEDNGYLFQIYCKDFSKKKKKPGKDNLHTMYFKMLFDEQNLECPVFKLSGGAEMFYRYPSLPDDKITHPAGIPIPCKNLNTPDRTVTFDYDIIKDRRFTKPHFQLHLPIELNFNSRGIKSINDFANSALSEKENPYVIGIDRGERNLIYISVIDANGNIVEQRSLNIISSDNGYTVDYHRLLDNREKEMLDARRSWKTIGSIKELKEGYISLVIHEICKLVIQYDAVIAMENLSSGFINTRKKVEKQVYQKFERMLSRKLNFLVDKQINEPKKPGGVLSAFQLTNKAETVRTGTQDGILFFVPAWNTSKIDPTTGFVNLFYSKSVIKNAKEFFEKFIDIRYNSDENLFEFEFDYSDFSDCSRGEMDYQKHWTVCSNAERIKYIRNGKMSAPNYQTVELTKSFKELFDNRGIDITQNLFEQIKCQEGEAFFDNLLSLFLLTVQMRNSDTDNDYIISPVKNARGEFYDSRKYTHDSTLPCDADANGAYNIARKGLWIVKRIKEHYPNSDSKPKLGMSNTEWLKYAQK